MSAAYVELGDAISKNVESYPGPGMMVNTAGATRHVTSHIVTIPAVVQFLLENYELTPRGQKTVVHHTAARLCNTERTENVWEWYCTCGSVDPTTWDSPRDAVLAGKQHEAEMATAK